MRIFGALMASAVLMTLTGCTGLLGSDSTNTPDQARQEKLNDKTYRYKRSSGCVNGPRKKDFNPRVIAQCAFLRGENLKDKDLTGADLRGATLEYAVVDGANFTNAKLHGANFTNVNMRAAKSWRGAKFNAYTVMTITADEARALGMIEDTGIMQDSELLKEVIAAGSTNKNNAAIEKLLKEGADPRTQFSNGDAFTKAVENENRDLVLMFIDDGHDINARSSTYSPLAATVNNKADDVLKLLLSANADPNERDGVVIRSFVTSKRPDRLKLLFNVANVGKDLKYTKARFPVRSCYADGACLIEAMDANSLDAFKLLLEAGASADGYNTTSPAEKAIAKSLGLESPYLDLLLAKRPRLISSNGCSTILESARASSLVRRLLAAGAPVTPSSTSCGEHSFFNIVKNIQADEQRGRVLPDTELVSVFTAFSERSALPATDKAGNPTIHMFLSQYRYFAALVTAGMQWNVKDKAGRSVVEVIMENLSSRDHAEFQERLKVIGLTLDRGQSLDEKDRTGDSLAFRMIRPFIRDERKLAMVMDTIGSRSFNANATVTSTGRTLIYQLITDLGESNMPAGLIPFLATKGMDLNQKSSNGSVPLAACPSRQCVLELLAAGANVMAKGSSGENVLMMRIKDGRALDAALLQEFLSKGLDLKDQDTAGRNLLDYAILFDTTGKAFDLLKERFPDQQFFKTKYIKCEDSSNITSVQFAYSNLGSKEFRGEGIRYASKSDNRRVTVGAEPLTIDWKASANGLRLSIQPQNAYAFVLESTDLKTFTGVWQNTSSRQTCSIVGTEPLPSNEYRDLFVDCKDPSLPATQDLEWIKLNSNGAANGSALARGRKAAATTFKVKDYAIFEKHNGYTIDTSGGRLHAYIPEAQLKAANPSKPVNVFLAWRSIQKVEEAEKSLECQLQLPPK